MRLTEFLGISDYLPGEYIRALVIFVALLFILRGTLALMRSVLIRATSKTKTDMDDIIIKRSSKPLTILAFLISFIISIREITLVPAVEAIVDKTIYSTIVIVIGYLTFTTIDLVLLRLWKKLTERTKTDIDDSLISLAHSALKGAFIVMILLYILNIWGVEIGPFLAGLGIAGLAVALALQPTLSNIFSGVALIIDRTFKVDDVIKIESGEMGVVHQIGLRATRIRTFDNEMIIVPNSTLANSKLQNYYQPDKRIRVTVKFGVEYGVDPEYVKRIVIEEIEKLKMIDKSEQISVVFSNMGDSSLDFKARFWVDDIDKKWPAHQEAITRIYRLLYRENIGIPFPQRTVWMRDEGKVKTLSPSDAKFKAHNKNFYSDSGHEYKPPVEEKKEEPKKKKSMGDKFLSRFKKNED